MAIDDMTIMFTNLAIIDQLSYESSLSKALYRKPIDTPTSVSSIPMEWS